MSAQPSLSGRRGAAREVDETMTQTVSRRPSSTESPIAGPTLPQPRRLTSAPTTQRLRKAVDGSSVGANVHAKTRALGRLAWIGSAVVMFVLATARLSWPAMWQDELATWGMAGVSWDAMPALLNQADLVLGPYYYVIRAWAEVFGTSDLALRMPSVLAMTAAAAGVAVLGTRLANPRVGFTAGLLFAVLPVTSRYAHEARPYALAICLAVFATLVLVESCSGRQRRARVARFAPYALLVALLGLVHAVALSLLVAHLAMVWVLQRRLVPAWMVAAAVGAAPGATLLYLGHRQRSQIAWIELARWDDLLAYPGMLFGGLALIGAAMVALALLGTSARQPGVLFTAWATLPVLAIFAVAWFTPLWTTRYLLFTVPAWALLGGLALGRTHLARAVLAVAVIAAIGIPAQVEQRDTDGHSQATRDVAAIIDRAAQPGDGVVFGSGEPGENRVGRDLVAHYLAPERRPTDLLVQRAPRSGYVFARECAEPGPCLAGAERIWLVRVGDHEDSLTGAGGGKGKALRDRYAVATVWRPDGMTLALMVRKAL